MGILHSYKELIVWQKAMDLVIKIYELTNFYPAEEKYGLVSETRKTSRSIIYNIAEGRRRRTRRDYCHFLSISFGSGGELETQIEVAKRLHLCSQEQFKPVDYLLQEVMSMLNIMISKLSQI